MAYCKVDAPLYKILWQDLASEGQPVDITKYLVNQSSEEGLTINNNKMSLTLKLIKDKPLDSGAYAPFFADNNGYSRLKNNNLIQPYLTYANSTYDITNQTNLLKSYYLTDWYVDEPNNTVSISAVDLAYKITNRNISKVYSYLYYEDSGFTATGTTFTDSSKSFPIPKTNAYDLGLKNLTLELTDTSGNQYLYLITNNTSTTCTTHETIATPVGSWASYRIGWNAPMVVYDVVKRTARPDNGAGELHETLEVNLTTDIQDDYKHGIQLLRRNGSGTQAFPIVNIGEPYMPVYKLINEISAYTACNSESELDSNTLLIKRDMVFTVTWNDESKKTAIDWFYPDIPVIDNTIKTITAIDSESVTVTNNTINDLGAILRIKHSVDGNDYYKSYVVIDIDGSKYYLSSNPIVDGIEAADTCKTVKGADFIWDNEDDYKQIYSMRLGSKDEEKFNHVLFNAGKNEVAGRDIIGHYYYEESESETLKETFIPMTNIAKTMMNWVTTGPDGTISGKVIKKEGDTWYGWDSDTSTFTDVTTDWKFSTTFGTDTIYSINSRTEFNSKFKIAAKKTAERRARALCVNQKGNTLTGSMVIRGQKFIKVGSTGDSVDKWYEKGTRILFKKPDAGLNNFGNNYYILIVKKIRHDIDSASWRTSIDVEYDLYDSDELSNLEW